MSQLLVQSRTCDNTTELTHWRPHRSLSLFGVPRVDHTEKHRHREGVGVERICTEKGKVKLNYVIVPGVPPGERSSTKPRQSHSRDRSSQHARPASTGSEESIRYQLQREQNARMTVNPNSQRTVELPEYATDANTFEACDADQSCQRSMLQQF